MIANIAYANGRVDTFFVLENNKISKSSPMLHADSLDRLAKNDARLYYTGYNGAATGTLLATFPGSPLLGLITACATSATAPKWKNLQFPNDALAGNDDYKYAYRNKAFAIKRGKVWTHWGLGVGITVLSFLAISSLSASTH